MQLVKVLTIYTYWKGDQVRGYWKIPSRKKWKQKQQASYKIDYGDITGKTPAKQLRGVGVI